MGWLRGLRVVHFLEDGFGCGGDFSRGILFLFGRGCWDLFRFLWGWFSFLALLCLWKRAPVGCLAKQVAEHAVPQFGFKPSAFWRQDAALVGDGYQVGDAEGMQRKGDAVWGFVR